MQRHRLGTTALLATLCVTSVLLLHGVATGVENETFGLAPFPEEVDGQSRQTFEIPLEVGETFEDAVRVYNRTDQSIELSLYATDAEAALDGAITVGFRGSEREGVGAWIELEDDVIELPPFDEQIVSFRIDVAEADPTPDLGAIVAENTASGATDELAQRLNVVVRTSPPNSSTTSERVRPLFLRSPWIILAILGLLLTAVLIWLGARRARKPQDEITEPGELAKPEPDKDTQEASRPVLHRLGSSTEEPEDEEDDVGEELTAVLARFEGAISEVPEPDADDERPPLEFDVAEDAPEGAEPRAAGNSTSRPKRKLDYIPLDEL